MESPGAVRPLPPPSDATEFTFWESRQTHVVHVDAVEEEDDRCFVKRINLVVSVQRGVERSCC